MRVFLGVLLGIALTVLGVYVYDTSTGRAANGLSAVASNGRPPMVNWDVVNDNWRDVRGYLAAAASDLREVVTPHWLRATHGRQAGTSRTGEAFRHLAARNSARHHG
jgi:hypothetical protein